jgi:hypothetical protein
VRRAGTGVLAVALIVEMAHAWPACVRYFGLHAGPMLAALGAYLGFGRGQHPSDRGPGHVSSGHH